jgi:hypothetical protein
MTEQVRQLHIVNKFIDNETKKRTGDFARHEKAKFNAQSSHPDAFPCLFRASVHQHAKPVLSWL